MMMIPCNINPLSVQYILYLRIGTTLTDFVELDTHERVEMNSMDKNTILGKEINHFERFAQQLLTGVGAMGADGVAIETD